MQQPDYSETTGSRKVMHDNCETKVRQMQTDARLGPRPEDDQFRLIDITTETNWSGRHLWDVKVMRSDNTVAVAANALQDYPDDLWIVIGRHYDCEPTMLIPIETLLRMDQQKEILQSGWPGVRFTLEPWPIFYSELRDLAALTFLGDPTELVGRLRCSTCRAFLPPEMFSLKGDNRRGYQSNCKHCDDEINRLNKWQRKFGLPKLMAKVALAVIQDDTCPGCGEQLLMRDARLRWESDYLIGLTHHDCDWQGEPSIPAANNGLPFHRTATRRRHDADDAQQELTL